MTLAVGDTLATEARAETLQIELDVLHQVTSPTSLAKFIGHVQTHLLDTLKRRAA